VYIYLYTCERQEQTINETGEKANALSLSFFSHRENSVEEERKKDGGKRIERIKPILVLSASFSHGQNSSCGKRKE